MSQMYSFVCDTGADCETAHDWVCEMLDISSFTDNQAAWDDFYNNWESAYVE